MQSSYGRYNNYGIVNTSNRIPEGVETYLEELMLQGMNGTIRIEVDKNAQLVAETQMNGMIQNYLTDFPVLNLKDVEIVVEKDENDTIRSVQGSDVDVLDLDEGIVTMLSTLQQVGIFSEHNLHTEHSSTIYIVDNISKCPPLYYGDRLIKDISFPQIGCDRMTYHIARTCCVVDREKNYQGMDKDRYIMGCREKIDGESAMIFSITLYQGEKIYFLWTADNLSRVDSDGLYFLEKKQEKYYNLNIASYPKQLGGLEILAHPYRYLGRDIIDSSVDGIMLLVDGIEYKVPRERIISLKTDNDTASIKTDQNKTFLYDKNNKLYKVRGVPKTVVGVVDVLVSNDDYIYLRRRWDRKFPDSTQAIQVIVQNMMLACDITKFFVVNKNSLGSLDDRFSVQYCSRDEKISIINDNVKKGYRSLVYVEKEQKYSRFWKADDGYVYMSSLSVPGTVGTRLLAEYHFQDPVFIRYPTFVMANVWFPGSIKVVVRIKKLCLSPFMAVITGFGPGIVFYFAQTRDYVPQIRMYQSSSISFPLISDQALTSPKLHDSSGYYGDDEVHGVSPVINSLVKLKNSVSNDQLIICEGDNVCPSEEDEFRKILDSYSDVIAGVKVLARNVAVSSMSQKKNE